MGALWRRSAIVLVDIGRGGLIVGKLHRVDIVCLVEDLRWLVGLLEINVGDLVHILEFLDMFLKFRCVGQFLGEFLRNSR